MRRPSPRVALGLGIPLLVIVLLVVAWAVDSASGDRVPRNVALAGRDIGKMSSDDLVKVVDEVAAFYLSTEVEIRTTDATFRVPAGDLGLRLDKEATVRAALSLDDDVPLWRRPADWLGSFLDDRDAPLQFTIDERAMTAALASAAGDAAATEPSLVSSSTGITMISGSPGSRISSEGVAEQILARARSGELPIVVDTEVVATDPVVSDAEVRELAERLTVSTAPGLTVVAGEHQAHIPAGTVRSWIGSRVVDGEIEVTVDTASAMEAVKSVVKPSAEPVNARITIEGSGPKIIPSVPGQICCADDSEERILFTIVSGAPTVTLDLELVEPEFTTADAEAMGIKEPVGTTVEWAGRPQVKSFTTYHGSKQDPSQYNRVSNIQRMADLVRGTLVKPGETFSMNAVVGRRTIEKGFLPAGAIANGEHVEEVGGGVSQFATTMFNAVFFAGLPFGEYQAHSEHFARYPYGREATMGWEHPDLQWTNDTPYGILIWTSYTDTSVTVTLWSTQHAWAEQTGQRTGRSGNCTTVTTERTIHYPDGSTKVDTVGARYRDRGATRC
jgi:vancomycin resistance protein YoaR